MAILLISFCLVGCGSGTTGDSGAVTPQGTIDLENLKVGVPENIIEGAVLSFQLDENPISRVGGKNQYLSINKDKKGGTYIAQCKDGYCFQLQALYKDDPITKEQALETAKRMLPERTPEQSKVDDSEVAAGKVDNPREVIFYGDDFYTEIVYADKAATKVLNVNVNDVSKLKDSAKADASGESAGAEKKDDAAETSTN